MFIWDFSAYYAFILILGVGLVLAIWMVYNFNNDRNRKDESCLEYFRQCRYCAHVYLDYLIKEPYRCPRCHSYQE